MRRKKNTTCEWTYNSGIEIYQTDCGKEFVITEYGTVNDIGMKFCCYCGKPLAEDTP